jgi:hypothetical protein
LTIQILLILIFSRLIVCFVVEKVPSWVPGTGWKAYAQKGKELTDDMINIPFNKTVAAMVCRFALEWKKIKLLTVNHSLEENR